MAGFRLRRRGGPGQLPLRDEGWTGVEHEVACHLMMVGMREEGLDIVDACPGRYDGRVRNAFDEYEAGRWYSRPQGLTGARCEAVDRALSMTAGIRGGSRLPVPGHGL